MTNKFLNGLWGRGFGGVFWDVFLEWFGSGGVEYAGARKMMRVIFWCGVLALWIGKGINVAIV
jgi:hypothetical protein